MEAKAIWVTDRQFVGESGSGHAVVMDASIQGGGQGTGPSPMELLLVGMAGCTGIDVVSILEKGRHAVTGVEVAVRAERASEPPRVFTHIEVEYLVWGRNLPEKAVRRAIELSESKYCSASIMLGKTAEIRTSYTIIGPTIGESGRLCFPRSLRKELWPADAERVFNVVEQKTAEEA